MAPRSSSDSYTTKRSNSKQRDMSTRRRSPSESRYHTRERYYDQEHSLRRSPSLRYYKNSHNRRQSRDRYSNSNSSGQSRSSRQPRQNRNRKRSYTRSPVSPPPPRRGTREHPLASRCIGVFGLNTNTSQHKIRELFGKFGTIERIQMVIDAHTGRSRGFCFIYFENLSDAKAAKDSCSGIEVDDRRIRVDYSITQRAHTPTPGIYMGRPSKYAKRTRDVYRQERRHTPSPYYRSNERERSRSHTPRRSSRY